MSDICRISLTKSYADYMKFKSITNDLRNQTKMPAILSSNEYTAYKGYAVENYNNPITPKFIICNSTNLRPNRVLFTHEMFKLDGTPGYRKNVDNVPKFRNKCKFPCMFKKLK